MVTGIFFVPRPAPGSERRAAGSGRPPRIALALSGGGYRASLHGLAALRALDNFGLLEHVRVVSGVSGGSITGGYYVYQKARARDRGIAFNMTSFESKLLYAISTYEVPRTVMTAEVLTTGRQAAEKLLRCAEDEALSILPGGKQFEQAVMTCVGEISEEIEGASLTETVLQFTGEDCPAGITGRETLAACVARGPQGLGAGMAAAMAEISFGADVRRGMMHSLCSLRLQLCATSPGRPPATFTESGHPFADLLHLALFKPWKGQTVVHMRDLQGAGVTLLVNASSNDHGELWTASQSSAGIRQSVSTGMLGTWRRYRDQEEGPALAEAVAASACFPLFCRPLGIAWGGGPEEVLIDGGVHDNLGVLAIRELVTSGGQPEVDLLVVANARQPFTESEGVPSRVDTVLRFHDMLMDQRSASTVRDIRQWWPKDRCPPVLVSLADADPTEELGRLRTDLLPTEVRDKQILNGAIRRFKRALSRNHCVKTFLSSRTAAGR